MAKTILAISTSLRSRSNSEALVDSFLAGAEAAGNRVEKISLRGKALAFCRGCLACQQTGKCIIRDDAAEIVEKMYRADVLVFATPIYYYGVSGQMKTLLDRANPLFPSDYAFRDVYLLSSATEDGAEVPQRAEVCLTGWVDCFEKAALRGTVFAGGVTGEGEINGHPALKEAYDMGAGIK